MLSIIDQTERRLLVLAGIFLGVFSLSLTLSNAVRLRSWQVDYPWYHWSVFALWAGFAWLTHRQLAHTLPQRDPFFLPITTLLTGWGLLTIWRLSTPLGLRQSIWFLLIGAGLLMALHQDASPAGSKTLSYLRKFKYVWLTSGLVLTGATLIFGTNPTGAGPRLWLGCCGIYLQPSEPLKLLLIVYLAAYLADRGAIASSRAKLLPLLAPTLIMTGVALLLLVFQRDLGTAVLFLALYATIIYAGTSDHRVLILSVIVLILAASGGYALFDVVHQRVDAWINPWLDPSGRSYQVVQSLLAVANGGLVGRGPGLGSPGLVPVAQSDFIFSAMSEEGGLIASVAVLMLLALLVTRGIRSAMQAADPFHRLLATGIIVHLVGQSILIIGGNLRLLPLTGVTLPFVSYGGSSLVVSFFELLCLLLISARQEQSVTYQPEMIRVQARTSGLVSGSLMLGLLGAALASGWWVLVRGPDLLTRTDNPRRTIADRYVKRGSILDRNGQALSESTGQPGSFLRQYPYPALGPLVGYTSPTYGQAGLEASLDPYLRGLKGYPGLTMGWDHLLYGQPPPGLDVTLSLDLDLQRQADSLLAGTVGALVLVNAGTGEILAMANSPGFDANQLDTSWESLVNDPASPLYDRAGMGLYPAGTLLSAFLLPEHQAEIAGSPGGVTLVDCAIPPAGRSWGELVAAGCPGALRQISQSLTSEAVLDLLNRLGFYTAPVFPVETLSSSQPTSITDIYSYLSGAVDSATGASFKVSPLQMALASAALVNQGIRPAPLLAVSVDTPQSGKVMLLTSERSQRAFQAPGASSTTASLQAAGMSFWQVVSAVKGEVDQAGESRPGYTWYIGGTLPDWQGAPLAIAVILEEENPQLVMELGKSMLQFCLQH